MTRRNITIGVVVIALVASVGIGVNAVINPPVNLSGGDRVTVNCTTSMYQTVHSSRSRTLYCNVATATRTPTKTPTPSQTPTQTVTPTATVTATPQVGVQLMWFYKPTIDSLLPTLKDNFDFFVLTHKDETSRDKLRELGVMVPIHQYMLLTEIRNPGNCTAIPRGNQIAWKPGDYCMLQQQHPDWFLKDAQGNQITGGDVKFLDPGNLEFRLFYLSRLEELQTLKGWDDLFTDNTGASLGRFRQMGKMPVLYLTDESYRDAVIGMLNFLQANYQGRIFGNVIFTNDFDGVWQEFIAPLDGIMVENFAAGWLGEIKTRAQWEEQMDGMEEAFRQGKYTLLVSQGEQNDTNRQRFSFASYLLIADQHAFFRYTKEGAYNEIWLYDNYSVDLGAPLSARYQEGVTWRRDFENGFVWVNPSTRESQIFVN